MIKSLAAPPGPSGLPLAGVLSRFRRDPAGFLLRTAAEYGDISFFRLGLQRIYFLTRPDFVEDVLVTRQSHFGKSRILQRAKVLLGEGLLTSEGQFHTRQRRLIQPSFYRERLQTYAETMTECGARARARWADGEVLDVAAEMMRTTLDVVGRTLFDCDVEGESADIGAALTDVISMFDTLLLPLAGVLQQLPLPSIRRAHRAREFLDRRIYRMIAERRGSAVQGTDLLSTLIIAVDEQGHMTDSQVRDEALTLLLAGHETTAVALTWTWYMLARHPEVEERFRAELRRVLNGRLPQYADLPALEYTERLLAESLRLYPPAWALGRLALSETRIHNHLIPPGSVCVLSPYVTHRDPRFWPNPERFDPDRFLPEAKATRPRFAYFPFGGGSRVCIGERFAWMEAVLLLATIGQQWRFHVAPEWTVLLHPQLTLRPRGGMRMIARRVLA